LAGTGNCVTLSLIPILRRAQCDDGAHYQIISDTQDSLATGMFKAGIQSRHSGLKLNKPPGHERLEAISGVKYARAFQAD
jgi:hypothetical protein